MSAVDFDLDTSDFDRKWPQFQRILITLPRKYLEEGAGIYESQMHEEIQPFSKSGRLDASVTSEVKNDDATIRTNTGYGKAVDEGRRGFHVEGNPLRFIVNGKVVFSRWANPGPAIGHRFKIATIKNAHPRILSMLDYTTRAEFSKIQ